MMLTDKQNADFNSVIKEQSSASRHKNERKSHKSKYSAKKQGYGGKYTWNGSYFDPFEYEVAIDSRDPNYDEVLNEDAKQGNIVVQGIDEKIMIDYKQEIEITLKEFFLSGDLNSTIDQIGFLIDKYEVQGLGFVPVKAVIRLAMDGKDRQRDLASQLIDALYGAVLGQDEIIQGFSRLLKQSSDIKLDVPNSTQLIAKFVTRAVADEVLPPVFIDRLQLQHDQEQFEIGKLCKELHSSPDFYDKAQACWGEAASQDFEGVKKQMSDILQEYLQSNNLQQTQKRVLDLGIPFARHEFVSQAVVLALQESQHIDGIVALIQFLNVSGDLMQQQVERGLQKAHMKVSRPPSQGAGNGFVDIFAKLQAGNVVSDSFDPARHVSDDGGHTQTANGHNTSMQLLPGLIPSHIQPDKVREYKSKCSSLLKDYLFSNDTDELKKGIEGLGTPELGHLFVKIAVVAGMEQKSRQRELVSMGLASVTPQPLSQQTIGNGFVLLLLSAEDLSLDVKDAAQLITLFLARAVVDNVVEQSFVNSAMKDMEDGSMGMEILKACGSMLSKRSEVAKVKTCWQLGYLSLPALQRGIEAMLTEYVTAKDQSEASRCLKDMQIRSYAHQVVFQMVEVAAGHQNTDSVAQCFADLITFWLNTGDLSVPDVTTGLKRVYGRLDDLVLDLPRSKQAVDGIVAVGKAKEWMSKEEFAALCPA